MVFRVCAIGPNWGCDAVLLTCGLLDSNLVGWFDEIKTHTRIGFCSCLAIGLI